MEDNIPNLEGYEVIRKIATGGMSVIYLANQVSLDRKVIIKQLKLQQTNIEIDVDRIKKEGLILAKLKHPNIVNIYDLIEDSSGTFLIEEWVEGVSLREILNEYKNIDEAIKPSDFINIASQIIKGIKAAHNSGIIHRDLKPENILIDKSGKVKICDFGISAIKNDISTNSMQYMVGTWEYMPPEMFEEEPIISEQGDIYSIGCVLYELLTKKLPFGFTNKTNIVTLIKRKLAEVPDFSKDIPEWFLPFSDGFKSSVDLNPDNRKSSIDNITEGLMKISSVTKAQDIHETNFESITKTIISLKMKNYLLKAVQQRNPQNYADDHIDISNEKLSPHDKTYIQKNRESERVKLNSGQRQAIWWGAILLSLASFIGIGGAYYGFNPTYRIGASIFMFIIPIILISGAAFITSKKPMDDKDELDRE